MLISLDLLKKKLGIDAADVTHDDELTAIVLQQTDWVEGETHRRFDVPLAKTETIAGQGRTTLWLGGHLELDNPDHPEWGDVIVAERVAWTDPLILDAATTYEAHGGGSLASLVRIDGYVWSVGAEYDITYYDGYVAAPDDIQALVMSLSVAAYRTDAATADSSAGITSETLVGVYSYTVSAQNASAEAIGGLTEQHLRTLNRWKRMVM